MDLEEMDIVELLEDVPVEPHWHVKENAGPSVLKRGTRGMVIHRHENSALYDIEFVDDATKEPIALARLRGELVSVVERFTLEAE